MPRSRARSRRRSTTSHDFRTSAGSSISVSAGSTSSWMYARMRVRRSFSSGGMAKSIRGILPNAVEVRRPALDEAGHALGEVRLGERLTHQAVGLVQGEPERLLEVLVDLLLHRGHGGR